MRNEIKLIVDTQSEFIKKNIKFPLLKGDVREQYLSTVHVKSNVIKYTLNCHSLLTEHNTLIDRELLTLSVYFDIKLSFNRIWDQLPDVRDVCPFHKIWH